MADPHVTGPDLSAETMQLTIAAETSNKLFISERVLIGMASQSTFQKDEEFTHTHTTHRPDTAQRSNTHGDFFFLFFVFCVCGLIGMAAISLFTRVRPVQACDTEPRKNLAKTETIAECKYAKLLGILYLFLLA
jgi:hypothetical protein